MKNSDEKEKLQLIRDINRRLKRAVRHKAKYEIDLKICLEWEMVQHEGILLQSYFYLLKPGMKKVDLPDWERDNQKRTLLLNPKLSHSQEISNRLKRSKKLRKGIPHMQNLLQRTEQEISRYTDLLAQVQDLFSLEDLENFKKQNNLEKKPLSSTKIEEKILPYREYYTEAGFPIWVGKSAKKNEELTFKHTNGSDWWLHVRDFPGSHVILKAKKKEEPDEESLQDALQLALHYSKAKDQSAADVCVTQCKYVSRFGKGHAGKVQISKHRVIQAKNDYDRLNQIKRRGKKAPTV